MEESLSDGVLLGSSAPTEQGKMKSSYFLSAIYYLFIDLFGWLFFEIACFQTFSTINFINIKFISMPGIKV